MKSTYLGKSFRSLPAACRRPRRGAGSITSHTLNSRNIDLENGRSFLLWVFTGGDDRTIAAPPPEGPEEQRGRVRVRGMISAETSAVTSAVNGCSFPPDGPRSHQQPDPVLKTFLCDLCYPERLKQTRVPLCLMCMRGYTLAWPRQTRCSNSLEQMVQKTKESDIA